LQSYPKRQQETRQVRVFCCLRFLLKLWQLKHFAAKAP